MVNQIPKLLWDLEGLASALSLSVEEARFLISVGVISYIAIPVGVFGGEVYEVHRFDPEDVKAAVADLLLGQHFSTTFTIPYEGFSPTATSTKQPRTYSDDGYLTTEQLLYANERYEMIKHKFNETQES